MKWDISNSIPDNLKRLLPIILLFISNIFMTFAWYGHLKTMKNKGLVLAIIFSWTIALFEYCLQVPANRIGSNYFTLPQLKILQEIITMVVFALFCIIYMKVKITADYIWATLCLIGAAYFIFRKI